MLKHTRLASLLFVSLLVAIGCSRGESKGGEAASSQAAQGDDAALGAVQAAARALDPLDLLNPQALLDPEDRLEV